MKRKALRALEALAFLALLAAVVAGLSLLTERKESREKLTPFFERAQDVDVLFFGSSHALNAVYPMELWHDYGITAYNFGIYNCTIPVSYWTLRCALETCTPKLVVVDIDDVDVQDKLNGSSADLHTALDGIPLTKTKAQAIEDLMDDPMLMDEEGHHYSELKSEFYFPLALYHSRWSSLKPEDFSPRYNAQLGADMVSGVSEPAEYSITSDVAFEEGYGFEYLRQLIALCQQQGIEVLLVNLPYPAQDDRDQRFSNAVYYLAQDCGVEYIDFVYLDQIVDYGTDCYDSASHLNASGARKVTDYLGAFIRDVYGVEDHRAQARYASWDADYDAYADAKLKLLREQEDLLCCLMLLHDAQMSACVYVAPGSALYGDAQLSRMLQNIGRRHLFEADTYDAVFADSLCPLSRMDEAAASGQGYLAVIDRAAGEVLEAVGDNASLDASFGKVVVTDGALTVVTDEGPLPEASQADAPVQIAVFDEHAGRALMLGGFDDTRESEGE